MVCMKPSGFSAESLAEVFRCRRSELVGLGAFILGNPTTGRDYLCVVLVSLGELGPLRYRLSTARAFIMARFRGKGAAALRFVLGRSNVRTRCRAGIWSGVV